MKFRYDINEVSTSCTYLKEDDSIQCKTPDFEEKCLQEIRHWGVLCQMDVSLDGHTFVPCEGEFIIYHAKLKASSIAPRCASISGGIEIKLQIKITDKIIPYMEDVIVGF